MCQLNMKEKLLAVLSGDRSETVPVISACQYITYETMEQAGIHWPQAHYDGEMMAELSWVGALEAGLYSTRVPYCQTVEAEALGAPVKKGGERHLPAIGEPPPYKIGEIPLFPEDFLQRGRIEEVSRAVSLLKEKDEGSRAVIGGVCGPFSIAASLIGIPQLLKTTYRKPEAVRPYIEIGLKAGKAFAARLEEAGADIIVVEDMMASLDMISPKLYREIVFPYEKELIDGLQVPSIIHICGKVNRIICDLARLGTAGISVESAVDIPSAKEALKAEGFHTVLIGAVHPTDTLLDGTPEDVAAEAKKQVESGIDILSPGCAVSPRTPNRNLKMMAEGAVIAERERHLGRDDVNN